jgi:ribosomal protein L23
LIVLKEETTMLKTISAALLAVSVLAAPALAAGQGNIAQAPVTKAQPVKATKSNTLNANAKLIRHHRHHKHMGALKKHHISKVTTKHGDRIVKRG